MQNQNLKKISLNFNDTDIKGLLLQEKEDSLYVKLSSGYQIVLHKNDCSNIEIETIENETKSQELEIKKNENLPNIAIFHTGGTIASKVDYATGAVSSKFTPDELISLFSELQEKANLSAFMIGNLMSEDMRFGHYNNLLHHIKEHANEFDGIIISHGTDTMHYTSAALQYSLENLNIPVILVGAQRSSDRASSDAYLNLEATIEFIKYNVELKKQNKPSFNRIGVCMHSTINDDGFNILDAINVKKMHSARRDAFKQINFKPACLISKEYEISNVREELFTLSKSDAKIDFIAFNESLKIGIFTAHPHLHFEEIDALQIYDGIIVSGTGLGHIGVSQFDEISAQNEKNLESMKKLVEKIPVCLGLQTVYGGVNANVYSSGRRLLNSGVFGNYSNLTVETQFAKLAYLLSKYSKEEITNELWMSNLEGFNSEKLVDLD